MMTRSGSVSPPDSREDLQREQFDAGAAPDAEQPVARLPLISRADVQCVLDWGVNVVAPAPAGDFLGWFEACAEATPDAAAVVFAQESLTYGALNGRANRLARCLQGLGVGPNVVVAVAFERSLEMIVAVLGVLKAGGAYAPVDPTYPADRVAFMLEDSQAPVLLTLERLKARFSAQPGVRTIGLDDDWASEVASLDADTPPRTAGPEDLAYVIYTSGSTGRPKGVAMIRGALSNLIAWQRAQWPEGVGGRVLQFASLSFDVSFQEIFSTFATGGCLVLISDEVRLDPVGLVEVVAERAIDTLFLPPVMLREFARAACTRGATAAPLRLRQIITAGELLNVDRALADWLATQPSCRVHNHYGPTEAHVVTSYTLPTGFTGPAPIGRPIHHARIYIVDRHGTLVPPNVAGELLIGGACLARGYFHRQELTAERFVSDPFDPAPGARVYRTGDLARWRPDGAIEFLGRLDRQVKIRGFRIELSEIERVLEEHPEVRQAVVRPQQWRDDGEQRLVAYVVAKTQTLSLGRDLTPYLKQKLPDYMVPAAIVPLVALPTTPNHKIDWAALPIPDWHRSGDGPVVAPRTETERRLAEVWSTVLGLDTIGVRSNFFDLGATSIDGAHLLAAIESTFHTRLPYGVLFEAPTLEQLATVLDRPVTASKWASLVPIRSRGTKQPFFCVHGGAGTVHLFESVSRHLSDDQPVYAFQPQGLYGGRAPHHTVEQMAAHYIQEMRTVQETGPYSIGGYCFGAIVAYEMARQLTRQGCVVSLLAFINAPDSLYYAERDGVRALPAAPMQEPESQSAGTLKRWYWWLSHQLRSGAAGRKVLSRVIRTLRIPVPPSFRSYFFFLNHLKAERDYVPLPYDGHMVLVRPDRLGLDLYLGWGSLVSGGIECVVLGTNGRERENVDGPWLHNVGKVLAQHLESVGRSDAPL